MVSLKFTLFPGLSVIFTVREDFRKFPPSTKFPENLQPYVCVCRFVIPSGAFCAARSRSPTPAFDSMGLRQVTPPSSFPHDAARGGGGMGGQCNGPAHTARMLLLLIKMINIHHCLC